MRSGEKLREISLERKTFALRYGSKLRAARLANGLSGPQFADSVGVHYNTLYRWEEGTHVPDMFYHARLKRALQVRP